MMSVYITQLGMNHCWNRKFSMGKWTCGSLLSEKKEREDLTANERQWTRMGKRIWASCSQKEFAFIRVHSRLKIPTAWLGRQCGENNSDLEKRKWKTAIDT